MEYLNKLFNIHDSLRFTNKSQLKHELPEQLLITKHLQEDDKVLEFGGSIGRSSCVINSILNNKKNHVVIEPSTRELEQLRMNRELNNFEYQIENSALSSVKLYSKKWYTYKEPVNGSVEVKTITYNELKNKYDIKFNVLIIDSEGSFIDTLKDYPDILTNITLLQIEHDFNSNEDLQYFNNTMLENGFIMKDKFLKTERYGPGMNWNDGVKTDPIFVSVWKK